MTDLCFADSNIPTYGRDVDDPVKRTAALNWMDFLWRSQLGRVSIQVINETYSAMRKRAVTTELEAIRADVRDLLAFTLVPITAAVVEDAWRIQDRFQLSWWDALIVATAAAGGCRYLLTEDLQEGQRFGDLLVVNPFTTRPENLP